MDTEAFLASDINMEILNIMFCLGAASGICSDKDGN
ncbi:MAG: hypothetical protein SCAL_000449 [Candidatus Syntrophoarchaeum caldarius]|uniref:Uncharacterized protein n=1 Tax=Candidatus Syntropharchaeum caldarium TaxID=1838285 RepID=A0A1F2PBZ6_9EURY|nr:MAG: hypothetical protein SCAL_000449 [Candidatus Syntrophoarchaeum caldarius]